MIILPIESKLYKTFKSVTSNARCVFFVGLPGVGKSLLLQQFVLIGHENGRRIHTLQWDVTRAAFEHTPENQAKYPEIDGSTQPILRKAVGLWAREGVLGWHNAHPDPKHLLVGELPLIGNRLIELVQKHEDEAESLLASEQSVFFLPVPSKAVRDVIEQARQGSIAKPRHEKEKMDAPPNVLRALWHDVAQVAYELGITSSMPSENVPYQPGVYAAVYQHLLQHRHTIQLEIDTILKPEGSAYEMDVVQSELMAEDTAVSRIMHHLETEWTPTQIEEAVSQWMNP